MTDVSDSVDPKRGPRGPMRAVPCLGYVLSALKGNSTGRCFETLVPVPGAGTAATATGRTAFPCVR